MAKATNKSAPAEGEQIEAANLSELDLNAEVTFDCKVPLHINGKKYEGIVTVPRHMADSMIPMIQAKIQADLAIFVGRKFLVQRLADNTLSIKEGVDVTTKP